MLKKILITLTIISIISVSGVFLWIKNKKVEVEKVEVTTDKDGFAIQKKLTQEEKLEQLKRRMNFRSIIKKGDFYSIKNMKETALQQYLIAYRRLPNDHVIERKIGDTYFEMKNYAKAYEYYKKIPPGELDEKQKDKMMKSLLYTGNKNMRDEFNKIDAPANIKEYYDTVLVCYTGIKNCVDQIKSYSGTEIRIKTIKKDIIDYENIGHIDSNSKYAIMAGDFLKNKDYLATAIISEETLTKRPNYSSVLKLAGFARYELGDYKKANTFLQKYYQIEPKDITATYMLGILNFYLEDYISSNLYLNAAVLNGYRPKNELQKRLAYNYYILGDKKNMLKVFRYILDEDDTNVDDYGVALYVAIETNELSKAKLRVEKGLKKFVDSDILYAFRGWIYRIKNEEVNALNDLNLAVNINPRNAIALYNLGLLYFDKKDYTLAKRNLNGALDADKNGTFGEDAKTKLKEIEKIEKALENSNSGAVSN